VKISRKTGRYAALLLGTVLVAAGVAASGASAMALASGCGDGSARPAPACERPGAGHRTARAEALALLRHRGSQWAVTGTGRSGAPALPRGVPGVVAPGTSSSLNGVFCTSASNCWAVGSFVSATSGAALNQALRWNGTNWSRVTVPSPGGNALGDFSELLAVRCRVASDCWAVGDYSKGGAALDQAVHWNGTKWLVVSTPTPGGTLNGDDNELFDVVCPGANTCWATGEYGTNAGAGITLNQLLRWNGTKWSLVIATPQPAGTSAGAFQGLGSVRCTSVSSCLAVGTFGTNSNVFTTQNEALRWNGTTWSTLTVPSPGGTSPGDFSELTALACTAASNCWAAGTDGAVTPTLTFLNQVMHWDGTAWSQDTTIADPDGAGQGATNELLGITCSSADNCWAVGDYGSIQDGLGEILNQALHWNGTAWSLTLPPDPGGIADGSVNSLKAVRCTATTNCWAVGQVDDRSNQALRWDGAMWSAG
jgi:hypothetical protein